MRWHEYEYEDRLIHGHVFTQTRAGFLWKWGKSRISVIGGKQAADVGFEISKDCQSNIGKRWRGEEEAKFQKAILDK
jgi:acetyl-CoA carboxylase carboxyltransferase component